MNDLQKTESSCFKYLPIEIWENILKKLINHPRALVSSSKVCRLWRHLVTAICKQFCLRHLRDIEVEELSDVLVHPYLIVNGFEEEENERNWVKIFWFHHETFINTEVFLTGSKSSPFPNYATSIYSLDPYLIISTLERNSLQTKLHFYNAGDVPFRESLEHGENFAVFFGTEINSLNLTVYGKISQISMLQLPTAYVALFSSSDVNFQAVILKGMGNVKATIKKLDIILTNPLFGKNWKISCENEWLLTCDPNDSSEFLMLYKASLVSLEKDLQLQLMFRLKSAMPFFVFHIFKSMVYTVEASGHVRGYKIEFSSEECNTIERVSPYSQSELKKDLRYPNPANFVRNFFFSSTAISAELLEYWHMGRDRDFWIVGDLNGISKDEMLQTKDTSSNFYNIHLHLIYFGRETGYLVTAVYYQRGIWFLGTEEGHIIGCKLKKDEEEKESASRTKPDFIDLKPWMVFHQLSPQPIVQIRPLFTSFGAIVAVIDTLGRCSVVTFASRIIS